MWRDDPANRNWRIPGAPARTGAPPARGRPTQKFVYEAWTSKLHLERSSCRSRKVRARTPEQQLRRDLVYLVGPRPLLPQTDIQLVQPLPISFQIAIPATSPPTPVPNALATNIGGVIAMLVLNLNGTGPKFLVGHHVQRSSYGENTGSGPLGVTKAILMT